MLLHRYRVAMVNTERKQLSGNVEVGETFVSGADTGGKRGHDREIEANYFAAYLLMQKDNVEKFIRLVLNEKNTDSWNGWVLPEFKLRLT